MEREFDGMSQPEEESGMYGMAGRRQRGKGWGEGKRFGRFGEISVYLWCANIKKEKRHGNNENTLRH